MRGTAKEKAKDCLHYRSPTYVLDIETVLFCKFLHNVVLECLGIGACEKFTVRKTKAGIALKKVE